MRGDVGTNPEELIDGATYAAVGSLSVLKEVVLEAVQAKFASQDAAEGEDDEGRKRKVPAQQDVEMTG